jgi:hypothetical protein
MVLGDLPSTIEFQTKKPIMLMPGLETKMRVIIDRNTGKPMKLQAFGLGEWQGREIQDYKLGLAFLVVPRCNLGKP